MRTLIRAAVIAAALSVSAGPVATASPAPAAEVVAHPDARSDQDRKRVQEYWTPEKMAAAGRDGAPDPVGKDADRLPEQDRSASSSGEVWGGGGQVRKSVGRL